VNSIRKTSSPFLSYGIDGFTPFLHTRCKRSATPWDAGRECLCPSGSAPRSHGLPERLPPDNSNPFERARTNGSADYRWDIEGPRGFTVTPVIVSDACRIAAERHKDYLSIASRERAEVIGDEQMIAEAMPTNRAVGGKQRSRQREYRPPAHSFITYAACEFGHFR
jgi:hypothetical protein